MDLTTLASVRALAGSGSGIPISISGVIDLQVGLLGESVHHWKGSR
jgi:hypothetical protein